MSTTAHLLGAPAAEAAPAADRPHLPPRPGIQPPPKRSAGWGKRSGKVALAAGLLGLGAYAGLSEAGFVSTKEAVVSAYVATLRAPIGGMVVGAAASVGDSVLAGDRIATITDERVDGQRLADLRAMLARHRADAASLEAQRDTLVAISARLREREARHAAAFAGYIAQRALEAERLAQARAARVALARRDLSRREGLGREGVAASADIERLRGEAEAAAFEASAAEAGLAAIRAQAAAAVRGMVLGDAASDVTYSAQRADEIAIRISEVERSIASSRAAEAEAAARMQEEERRHALMSVARLTAPSDGMVWKLRATSGERLAGGDAAAEIVDCRAAFVLAAIPQERVPDITVGGKARVRVSGEDADRDGTVLSVSGDERLAGDRNLAAAPMSNRPGMATVRVTLAPGGNRAGECPVGRTARILLPVQGTSLRSLLPSLL